MAKANSNASSSQKFDPNNDNRFSFNSAYMNIVRIKGMSEALEEKVEDLLFIGMDSEVYLQLNAVLAMAKMCNNLSGELLEHSDNIVVTAPKEVNHDY
jgi:hypothetical protein